MSKGHRAWVACAAFVVLGVGCGSKKKGTCITEDTCNVNEERKDCGDLGTFVEKTGTAGAALCRERGFVHGPTDNPEARDENSIATFDKYDEK